MHLMPVIAINKHGKLWRWRWQIFIEADLQGVLGDFKVERVDQITHFWYFSTNNA